MFLRFVVPEIDEDSEPELGVFQAIHKLRKSGVLSGYEEVSGRKLLLLGYTKPGETPSL